MQLRDEEIARKIKEALVMALLREHHISQGQAAETLGVDRHELFGLIRRHPVPVVDLTPEELKAELQKPFPRSYG
jgi:predicted HTH domain antitoxin